MKINNIFYSIQGEGTNIGRPCIFVRTSGCNLNCSWCDTRYHVEGKEISIPEILEEIEKYPCSLVEITGGEPLIQLQDVTQLSSELFSKGYEVMIETNGTRDIDDIDAKVKVIVDIKCLSSGNPWSGVESELSIESLEEHDEIKFVVGDKEDFEFAKKFIYKYLEDFSGAILISPVFGQVDLKYLVREIKKLNDKRVRFQIQLHKIIWDMNKRGV